MDSSPRLDERGPGMHLSSDNDQVNLLPDWTESIQQSYQLGYSSVTGSNSFVELEQVMRHPCK